MAAAFLQGTCWSPEQGARPSALCSRPCLACLPTSAPFPPSLGPPPRSSPAASSPLGFPLGLQGGGGTVSPPGRAEGGLGPTLLQPWPGPAWPFQLRIYFSPLAFQPRRSREGEDVTSSARHLSPGVPQGSPQAAPAQLPAPSSHPGGVQWTTRRWRWDGPGISEKGVDRGGNGLG